MEKSSARPWDWLSACLLFLLIQVAAARLVTTNWAPFLYFTEKLAAYGTILGLALGTSRYVRRTVIWFVIDYTVVLLPWQMTGIVDARTPFWDRIVAVSGILFTALNQFLQRQPVKDPFFFVAFASLAIWIIGLAAGYWLMRHGNLLAAVVPAGVAVLLIQVYDNFDPRSSWWLAVFILLALLLLGREYYLKSRKEWLARRVRISEEAWSNIFSGLFMTTALAIVIAWMIPTSLSSLQAATDAWNNFTRPMRERLSNAVTSLDAPYGSGGSNFYGDTLALGHNAALGDSPVFTVRVLDTTNADRRYYWRGHVYDFYSNGQWISTPASHTAFRPTDGDLEIANPDNRSSALFQFTLQLQAQSLLYAPSQPVWINKPGNVIVTKVDEGVDDVLFWEADPPIETGSRYQVRARIADPNVRQLRAAGDVYPKWVKDRYLEIPENIRPEIQALAEQITSGQETPYDKATAVTNYLRANIEYSTSLPEPPSGRDPLLWLLFTYKKGFCNYYASAEVMLLRSVGVPARLAVGFAQGEQRDSTYVVRKRDAHAWPEVYFPGVGWVEFEPTVSQDALARPNTPGQAGGAPINPSLPRGTPISELGDERNRLNPETLDLGPGGGRSFTETPAGRTLVIVLALLGATLLIFLIYRYRILVRMPLYLSQALERGGVASPAWIENWWRWNQLVPVERSFWTINLSLRWLGKPQAPNATPAERARLLKKLLPSAAQHIEVLTSELQSGLFSPRPANASRARRAGFLIVVHTVRALVLNWLGAIFGADVYSG
jgi:transglutaminase-like putative cysteine protease